MLCPYLLDAKNSLRDHIKPSWIDLRPCLPTQTTHWPYLTDGPKHSPQIVLWLMVSITHPSKHRQTYQKMQLDK